MEFFKSKKGSGISITILLVLVLVLGVATLGVMVKQNSNISEQLDINQIQQTKIMKKQSEYLIKVVAESNAVESYAEIVGTRGYAGDECEIRKGEVVFCSLNNGIDEKFKSVFKNKFISVFPDEFSVSKESLSVVIENGGIEVKGNFEASKSGSLNVNHSWKEENEFSFSEIGLDYFDEIYRGVERCRSEKNADDLNSCLRFGNFNVAVSKTSDSFLVSLKSKKKFVLDGEFRALSFSFLV
ncbi:hypothetical protein COV15_02605 [Candidatus Woesearchaeota archaeon CG10_big_fil_rev_8_21_14_0_10_34_12]|nr:MAG: hypothetical protein COV15_02605 [Candidatus Woesearchaeota archaeon CG10_big_fil_rev_8_21_14_0_10_34_12]